MSARPQIDWLPDGQRLHLHHGPIDIIMDAEGPDRDRALDQAAKRFESLLDDMIPDLAALRQPLHGYDFKDPVARRMAIAVAPFDVFVTPMAAVAGAVADEIVAAACDGCQLFKLYANNGGDIAFHLAEGAVLRVASPVGTIACTTEGPARGLATSGWRGRSHSFGIADAVTVAAHTGAIADAAATLIANAVNLPDHPAIERSPASDLSPESDLGDRAVTTHVGWLSNTYIDDALAGGLSFANQMVAAGLISQAVLALGGEIRTTDPDALKGQTNGRISHPETTTHN